MVKIKRKLYALPLLAAAGAGMKAIGGGSAAMGAFNIASTGTMAAGLAQGVGQMKQADEHQEENAKLQRQQIAAENKKAEAIQNLANSGASGAARQAVQYAASDTRVLKNQKLFARYNMQDIKGFGKDFLGHMKKNKKTIGGFIGFGVAGTTGKYIADKMVQQDKSIMQPRNDEENQNQPRSYSITAAAMGMGIGALGTISSYVTDKTKQEEMVKKTKKKDKQFSVSRAFRNGMTALKRGSWNHRQDMGVIERITNGPESKIYDPRTWHWLKKVKHNPVRGLANVYNSFSMMGGETGMKSFKNSLVGTGTSGSRLSKDVANFMDNHGATSMAAIGAIGGGALMKASELADKGTEKVFRTVDKNAFRYNDSKEEEIR